MMVKECNVSFRTLPPDEQLVIGSDIKDILAYLQTEPVIDKDRFDVTGDWQRADP